MAVAATEVDGGLGRYLAQCVEIRRQLVGPNEAPYQSLEDFVLQHGQAWTPAPLPKGFRRGTPKHCYDNAYHLVASPRGERLGLRYVEGFARNLIAVLHAWAVTPDGTVIDPTWDKPEERAYFGVAFPLEVVDAAVALHGYYGVIDDWRHNWPLLQQPYEPAATLLRLWEMAREREQRKEPRP